MPYSNEFVLHQIILNCEKFCTWNFQNTAAVLSTLPQFNCSYKATIIIVLCIAVIMELDGEFFSFTDHDHELYQ